MISAEENTLKHHNITRGCFAAEDCNEDHVCKDTGDIKMCAVCCGDSKCNDMTATEVYLGSGVQLMQSIIIPFSLVASLVIYRVIIE